jgi:alpha-N-arabinofuranosidase
MDPGPAEDMGRRAAELLFGLVGGDAAAPAHTVLPVELIVREWHSDRVTAACLAQLVNVIAPIRTEPGMGAWRQTIFYPFALTARHARGEVLRVEPGGPNLPSDAHGHVPAVDVTATRDPETGQLTIFAVNRDEHDTARLDVRLGCRETLQVIEHVVIGGEDLLATNSKLMPNRVAPRTSAQHHLDGTQLSVELPQVSWTMTRLRPVTG